MSLCSLFVEGLELLQNDVNSGLVIDDIIILLLLFADDMAIVGKILCEIQNHLNNLLVVFRKRGGLLPTESWTYNRQSIQVVDDFNYLGVVLN